MNKSLWNSWSKRKYISPVKRDVARIGLQTALAFKCSWVLCASMKTLSSASRSNCCTEKYYLHEGNRTLQILRKKPSWPFKFRNKFKKRACKNSGLIESLVTVCRQGLCQQFREDLCGYSLQEILGHLEHSYHCSLSTVDATRYCRQSLKSF